MATALEREQQKKTGTTFTPASPSPNAPKRPAPPAINHPPDESLKDESFVPRTGDWVFYWASGDINDKPQIAIVTMDGNQQRALCMAVFYPGISGTIAKDAVKHYADQGVTEKDRTTNGLWAWNRKPPKVEKPTDPKK